VDVSSTLGSSVVVVPKTKVSVGKPAFSVAAPTLRSQIQLPVKWYDETIAIYYNKIQSYFLEIAFRPKSFCGPII